MRTMTWTSGYGPYAQRHFSKGDRQRTESQSPSGIGPTIAIRDFATGEETLLLPQDRYAQLNRYPPQPRRDYDLMADLASQETTPLGERVVDGRTLVGIRGAKHLTAPDETPVALPVEVWYDPATRLPVEIQDFDPVTGRPAGIDHDIRHDVELDDALFTLDVPAGYEVNDTRGDAVTSLRPPATPDEAAALIVRPGVGIGDLRLGDPVARIVEVFGEPENAAQRARYGEESGHYLYPSRGLRTYAVWRAQRDPDTLGTPAGRELIVGSIFADDDAMSWPGHPFPGATPEGIRLGSPRADVERAYGRPAQENAQNADYHAIGLAVTYTLGGATVAGFLVCPPRDQPIFGAGLG